MTKAIYVFYGFSGSTKRPTPSYPSGTDYDKSFQLTAETLRDSLVKLFPSDTVQVVQAWSKDKILDALEGAADGSVRQVHIACHGDSTRLSLAYHFDDGSRLADRAKKFDAMTGTDNERTIAALRDEDALIAGYFTHGIDRARLAKLKKKLAPDAAFQVWGCYAGYADTTFAGVGDAALDPYFKRFNLGKTSVPGVAIDIAKNLGVTVTAARGLGGLEFWHGTKAGGVEKNDTKTAANKPFWLWNVAKSTWVTYDASGAELSQPTLFQKARTASELSTGKPPRWLTDYYFKSAADVTPIEPAAPPPKAPSPDAGAPKPASPVPRKRALSLSNGLSARRAVGRVVAAWYDDGAAVGDGTGAPRDYQLALAADPHANLSPPNDFLPARVDPPNGEEPRALAQGILLERAFGSPAVAAGRGQSAIDDVSYELPRELAQALAEDDGTDFEERLAEAARPSSDEESRRYVIDEESRRDEISESETETPDLSYSESVFDRHRSGAGRTRTYDLGRRELTRRRLDGFAGDVMAQALAVPAAARATPPNMLAAASGMATQLAEGDLTASLALVRQAKARRPAAPAPREPIFAFDEKKSSKPPELTLHQKVPDKAEDEVVGAIKAPIKRDSDEFKKLVRNDNPDIEAKDEEGTGADRMMSPRLKEKLDALAVLVKREWPGKKLRITEAWDENMEHRDNSLHYEGRAADLTVSDKDKGKLGRLAQLAVDAGLDWVFYEDTSHVHGSVKRDAVASGSGGAKP